MHLHAISFPFLLYLSGHEQQDDPITVVLLGGQTLGLSSGDNLDCNGRCINKVTLKIKNREGDFKVRARV